LKNYEEKQKGNETKNKKEEGLAILYCMSLARTMRSKYVNGKCGF
jgi:hypothetical protein